jgi:hypothetical protein
VTDARADAPTIAQQVLSFQSPVSALEHEHRRLMDEHHQRVDWSRSTADSLAPPLRDALASLWRARALSEHRSVSIFATYTLDLLAAGAPAPVLSLACRASLDEVRHAELFTNVTRCYSGRDEAPTPGVSPLPDDSSLSLTELAAVEALHLCVGAETYSTALLHTLHANATDPVVRGAVAIVLSDELHHARMGWSYLASLLDAASPERPASAMRETLQRELVSTFDGLAKGMFGDPERWPVEPLSGADLAIARGHGYLTIAEQHALFCETVRDVWLPGLAALGLDPSALRGRYDRTSRD